jgi:hypothetical protein
MGEVVSRCGIGSVIRIIVWERSVCESEQKKDTMSLRFCSWLISFGEFMYGKMHCAYMTSCVAAEGEVLFGKMRHDNKDMDVDWLRCVTYMRLCV